MAGPDEPPRPEPASKPPPAEAARPAVTGRERFSHLRALGSATLAILLYLVLFDAAVETFRSGSPVRWVVVAAVAIYAAATVLLWRRVGWATKSTASLLVLLVLLVLTTWLPDGVMQGVRFMGQSTSTVMALVTAVAVLLAGVGLVRLKFLPHVVRGIIGFVAAYGVAAFLYGVARGTVYSALLRGRSLWDRLPFWLQGAFLGVLVLVPVALLLHIATGPLRTRDMRVPGRWIQVFGLSVGLVIALAGLRAPAGYGVSVVVPSDGGSGRRLSPVVFARGESGGNPVGQADRFEKGIKAVHAFVRVEGLKAEDIVSAVWYRGKDKLHEEQITISEVFGVAPRRKGRLRFTLAFEEGAPPGGYFLEVNVNGHLALLGSFAVFPK